MCGTWGYVRFAKKNFIIMQSILQILSFNAARHWSPLIYLEAPHFLEHNPKDEKF